MWPPLLRAYLHIIIEVLWVKKDQVEHLLSYRHTIVSESLFHFHKVLTTQIRGSHMSLHADEAYSKHSILSSRGYPQPGRCNCRVPEKLPHERSCTVYPSFPWCSDRLKSPGIFHRFRRRYVIREREARQLQPLSRFRVSIGSLSHGTLNHGDESSTVVEEKRASKMCRRDRRNMPTSSVDR